MMIVTAASYCIIPCSLSTSMHVTSLKSGALQHTYSPRQNLYKGLRCESLRVAEISATKIADGAQHIRSQV